MNGVIGFAPTIGDKYPEKEQQNGKLGGEYNGVVNDLDYIGQLRHIPKLVMTIDLVEMMNRPRLSPAPIRPGLSA